jgi:hypothetical protein
VAASAETRGAIWIVAVTVIVLTVMLVIVRST